jgi:adenine/guanine phosphoribosyltransferase-like PRPP-binding protein
MDSATIWQILAAGGLPRPITSADPVESGESARLLPKFDGLADPAGTERLGQLLARHAASLGADTVLLWEDPLDIVLGYIVARELGVNALRAQNQEGLLELLGRMRAGARVLLMTDAVREPTLVRALSRLVEMHRGQLVGTAVLVETDALVAARAEAGTLLSLVSLRDDALHVGEDQNTGV